MSLAVTQYVSAGAARPKLQLRMWQLRELVYLSEECILIISSEASQIDCGVAKFVPNSKNRGVPTKKIPLVQAGSKFRVGLGFSIRRREYPGVGPDFRGLYRLAARCIN